MPPKYFPSKSCVLDIGFERSKSIFPFSNIRGIKLEEANIASSRHKFDKGAVIANCICVITSANTNLLFDGFMLDNIESASTRLNTTARPIKNMSEITVKKIKTFLAKASLNVYHEMMIKFFTILFSFLLL